jgi:anti-sigma B factor antagonist
MKIDRQNDTLRVSEVSQLDASNALAFRAAVAAALAPGIRNLEIDLAQAECVDCGGLGALVALRKSLLQNHPEATLSLVHLAPPVQRLLQLTRMDRLFTTPSVEGTVLPIPGPGGLGSAPPPGMAALRKDLPEEPLSAVA